MSSRNRDMGFGRVAFSLLLEIDLVTTWGWLCACRVHMAGVKIFLVVEMVLFGYELISEK